MSSDLLFSCLISSTEISDSLSLYDSYDDDSASLLFLGPLNDIFTDLLG